MQCLVLYKGFNWFFSLFYSVLSWHTLYIAIHIISYQRNQGAKYQPKYAKSQNLNCCKKNSVNLKEMFLTWIQIRIHFFPVWIQDPDPEILGIGNIIIFQEKITHLSWSINTFSIRCLNPIAISGLVNPQVKSIFPLNNENSAHESHSVVLQICDRRIICQINFKKW